MKPSDLPKRVAAWRGGPQGFFSWLEDVHPVVPSYQGGWQPFEPSDLQRDELARALDPRHRTVVLCWPRRWGKTACAALVVLWRLMSRGDQRIAVVANSDRQVVDTAFRLVTEVIQRTEFTRGLVEKGVLVLQRDEVLMPSTGSSVGAFPSSAAQLWGKRLNCGWISELHAASSAAAYQALAGSTLDAADGLVLVDSTTGPRSSPLHQLFSASEQDDAICFSHVSHKDLEDAVANRPPWISEPGLRSLARTMLPQEFRRFHLNGWADGSSALFTEDVLLRCVDDYPTEPKALADGQAFHVGGGLDRAYSFSLHGDATVATAVLKMIRDEEPEFYVLRSDRVRFSLASGIKATLHGYARDMGMTHLTLETPNTTDVAAWAQDQLAGVQVESIFPSLERKAQAYLALHQAAAEGRLHVHPDFADLLAEMRTVEYTLATDSQKGATPKFHHARGTRDDFVDSLAWAVFSLRQVELPAYALDGVHCDAPATTAGLCILNGGQLVPPCADSCRSMANVRALHDRYLARHGPGAMSLERFFPSKVANLGSHSVRR